MTELAIKAVIDTMSVGMPVKWGHCHSTRCIATTTQPIGSSPAPKASRMGR